MKNFLFTFLGIAFLLAQESNLNLDYEKFTLDNGLDVILHKDSSDPTIALVTLFHVGSNREEPGKTGFAHFFEHMAFNDSENVPRGSNRKVIPQWGGSRNGGTWSDGTIYYEEVPKDAFEKILWIDSDRMGYMINTVTKAALEREKQVVKNEKRQRVDNNPYGFTDEIIRKNLYPKNHPYNWTVIGSLPDLQAATLEDVKEFYSEYYGPNNATLVIAGDIEIEDAKKQVTKWFGEIKRGKEVAFPKPQPVSLNADKVLYFEDNFAKLPEIRWTFPTVEQNTKENVALEALSYLLSDTKESPLYQVLVEESKLAPSVSSYQNGSELAGTFTIRIRANAGVDLDDVNAGIAKAVQQFATKKISENDLETIKAQTERRLYSQLETTLGKAQVLASGNEYAQDPLYVNKEVNMVKNLTAQDIKTVFEKYILNRAKIVTNFVPKGETTLAMQEAKQAEVWQEKVQKDVASEEVSEGEIAKYEKTASSFPRTEPGFRALPKVKAPEIITKKYRNLTVRNVAQSEVPMVRFSISFTGGKTAEENGKEGSAQILADWLQEGTTSKTPAQFEKELQRLGATIGVSSNFNQFEINVSCLAKNFEETTHLLLEMIQNPRFSPEDFKRIKQAQLTRIKDRESQPPQIGFGAFMKLLYGDSDYGRSALGSEQSVKELNANAVEEFYLRYKDFISSGTLNIIGEVKSKTLKKFAKALTKISDLKPKKQSARKLAHAAKMFSKPAVSLVNSPKKGIYFIDVPNSKQSVLIIGKTNKNLETQDFHKLRYATEILGGGSSGRLFQTLRIGKGYTYGASRGFRRMAYEYPFYIYTNVRANATKKSLDIIRDMVKNYAKTFTDSEAEITKNKIAKSLSRRFESQSDKLNILENISRNDLPHNYIEQEQNDLVNMSTEDFKKWINTYVKEEDMYYLIVGDKATQLQEVQAFAGEEKVIELDIKGNQINQ